MGMVRRGHTVCLAVPPGSKLRELAERNGLEVEVVALKKGRDDPLVLDFLSLISRHRIQVLNTHVRIASCLGWRWVASREHSALQGFRRGHRVQR